MDKRNDIIAGASEAFDAGGLRGAGIDGILAPSGTSTRTLYKHFGSRDGLVLAVLEDRDNRFMERLSQCDAAPVDAVFEVLRDWLRERGANGCMLMRARAEFGSGKADIVALVRERKRAFEEEVAARVEMETGREDAELATQIWLLFEGATAAASVADLSVVDAAQRAARLLVVAARERAR
ncbi:TetR/AcrR family transcriptional regulator [Aureimonas mangrovi]|uniref:TetR/AcrR family transcriptional regulator n=1 Tax=Aureimonas mangrovi TaxID=2758041 RepID=UPI00163D5047|nr:TetR/AcrR family transcriptional regulator [Aureimonas mangrovi]